MEWKPVGSDVESRYYLGIASMLQETYKSSYKYYI
jgi:hypothetical protein